MSTTTRHRPASPTEGRVKSRYTPRQIIAFLRAIDEGRASSIAQACQRMNISRQTYYYWRQRYGHSTTSAPARLIVQLDRDIRRLSEQLAAQQALLDRLKDELDEEAEIPAPPGRPSVSASGRVSETPRCAGR